MRKSEYVVVISLDAVSQEDFFNNIDTLYNLNSLVKTGVYCTNVSSVLPAQTYTIHTSIVTGVYPKKHGIVNNYPVQVGLNYDRQKWFSYEKEIKSPTIYQAAKAKGLKTASFLWPVTEKSCITYNLPEVASGQGSNQIKRIICGGSTLFLLSSIVRFAKDISTKQPQQDIFNTLLASHTIKHKKPHLSLIHLTNIDTLKHDNGIDTEKIAEALQLADSQVGEIIKATKDAGIFDKTTFFIVSDHGQIPVYKRVRLNNILARHNLIQLDATGSIIDWDAYCQTTGNAVLLTVKNNNQQIIEKLSDIFKVLEKNSLYGIKDILDKDTVYTCGGGDFSFVIQGEYGIYFEQDIVNYLDEHYDVFEQITPCGTHGYIPSAEKEWKLNPIFIACGCSIVNNGNVNNISVLDYAPTIAQILDLDAFPFKDCDGRVLEEIF